MKLLAMIGGILIAIMVTLNGELSRSYPPFMAVLIFNAGGLIIITVIALIKKSEFSAFRNKIPVYLFFPGAFSILLTILNNLCVVRIGVSVTLALALAGQSMLSVIIDSFGLMTITKTPFDKRKLIGFAAITAGIVCLIYL